MSHVFDMPGLDTITISDLSNVYRESILHIIIYYYYYTWKCYPSGTAIFVYYFPYFSFVNINVGSSSVLRYVSYTIRIIRVYYYIYIIRVDSDHGVCYITLRSKIR